MRNMCWPVVAALSLALLLAWSFGEVAARPPHEVWGGVLPWQAASPLLLAQVAPGTDELARYRGLHAAAAGDDAAEIALLVATGADLDARDDHGRTPLMVAAQMPLCRCSGWVSPSPAAPPNSAWKAGLPEANIAAVSVARVWAMATLSCDQV